MSMVCRSSQFTGQSSSAMMWWSCGTLSMQDQGMCVANKLAQMVNALQTAGSLEPLAILTNGSDEPAFWVPLAILASLPPPEQVSDHGQAKQRHRAFCDGLLVMVQRLQHRQSSTIRVHLWNVHQLD